MSTFFDGEVEIPVHIPRSKQEPFHSTLGVVQEGYPIDHVIQEINSQIPVFNKIPVSNFHFTSRLLMIFYDFS